MNKSILLGSLASVMMTAFPAAAMNIGGSDVGGGQGVVCRTSNHAIHSVELLDLWEAREVYHLKIANSSASIAAQVSAGLDQMKYAVSAVKRVSGESDDKDGVVTHADYSGVEALRFDLADSADSIERGVGVNRLRGVNLQLTKDAYEVATPVGCQIEQIVRYTDTNNGARILINQDLFDHMNNTNKAALYLHESLYAELRGRGEPSSLRVRRAVGLTFSGFKFTSLESLLPENFYVCKNAQSRVYVYGETDQDEPGNIKVRVMPDQIGNHAMIGFADISRAYVVPNVDQLMISAGQAPLIDTLGTVTGFDYNVEYDLGGAADHPQMDVQLTSGPDLSAAPAKETLACEMRQREDFFGPSTVVHH